MKKTLRRIIGGLIFIMGVAIADNVFVYLNTKLNMPEPEPWCLDERWETIPCNKGEARPE